MARKIKGFSRVDSGDAHGWLVRIKRGNVKRSRFISDATHGGKNKSKKLAQEVYDEWVKELPEPDTAENKLGKRNTSGVVGVHYSFDVDARYPGCAYEYYIASWKTDDGTRQNVRFAVSKWGKQAAFELACIAREMRSTDRAKIEQAYERSGKTKKKAAGKPKTSSKGTKKTSKKTLTAKLKQKKTTKKKVAKKGAKKK